MRPYAIEQINGRKERLRKYVELELSDYEISKILDLAPTTVTKTRERLGLKKGDKKNEK